MFNSIYTQSSGLIARNEAKQPKFLSIETQDVDDPSSDLNNREESLDEKSKGSQISLLQPKGNALVLLDSRRVDKDDEEESGDDKSNESAELMSSKEDTDDYFSELEDTLKSREVLKKPE